MEDGSLRFRFAWLFEFDPHAQSRHSKYRPNDPLENRAHLLLACVEAKCVVAGPILIMGS